MKKQISLLCLLIATALCQLQEALAQTTDPIYSSLNIARRTSLRGYIGANNQVASVYGLSSFGDTTPELWRYDSSSTTADNGSTVLKPTDVGSGETGRWIFVYKLPTGDIPFPTINFSPGRVVNTTYQNTGSRPMLAVYSISASVTNPLVAGSSTVNIYGEISTNGTTWTTPTQNSNSSSVGLAVAIQITNGQTGNIVFPVPVGYYFRVRTVTTGTATASIVQQWEMSL